MRFPLAMQFKILALAPQIAVTDADGNEVLYVQQKMFKLKEEIRVYRDRGKADLVYEIRADRVLDFSARYGFTDAGGNPVGSVKRAGARSLWRAHYDVAGPAGEPLLTLREENPWVKLLDGLLDSIPILGALTGYFLHPRYALSAPSTDRPLLRVIKRRSFFESRFDLVEDTPAALPEPQEVPAVLAVLMMALLERSRG
jgi:hypothetical protein